MEKRKINRELANSKELEITIDYEKGTDYPYRKKGIYARLTEVKNTPYTDCNGQTYVLQTWSSGDPYETVYLQSVSRGSQKKVDLWRDAFEECADEIADLWNKKQYKSAALLIFNLVPADF